MHDHHLFIVHIKTIDLLELSRFPLYFVERQWLEFCILNLPFLFTLISDEPERGNTKLRRNQSLKKSFRKMAEAVHLRPKKSPSNFMFRASKVLRKSRQPDARLTENASPNRVFGQNLENLEMDTFGLPKFLPKVISKIEGQISTEGLYRINGDLNFVSKLR